MLKPAALSAIAGAAVIVLTVAPEAQAETLADRVRACAGIPEAGPRLACFDRLAADTTRSDLPAPAPAAVAPAAATLPAVAATAAPAAASPAAAPPADVPSAAASQLSPEQRFGREQSLFAESTSGDQAVREISATVTSVRAAKDGRRSFDLDNGQVWMHTETPTREYALRAGDRVTIRRGALSSFVLLAPGQPSIRVRRVR
jgi:hypothetical protein